MKSTLLVLSLTMSQAFAIDFHSAIVRDKSLSLTTAPIEEEDLFLKKDNKDFFEKFNIVKSTNDSQIPLRDLSDEERLRVITLNYHLNRAREYFERTLKSDYVTKLGAITVRYDMAKSYSSAIHFGDEDERFNNAVTNKSSNKYKNEGVQPWGIEIWFRPGLNEKNKLPKGAISRSADTDMTGDVLSLADTSIQDLVKRASLGYDVNSFETNHFAFQLGLIFLLKNVVPNVLDLAFSSVPMNFKLDTAMVPEIIYHEYAHVAMSDFIPLTSSYVVSEGMANYFASVILGKPSIGMKGASYIKNAKGYEFDKKLKYRSVYDTDTKLAHNSFTLSYLWRIREKIQNEYQDAELFDQIVYEARKHIDVGHDRSLLFNLPDALRKATDSIVDEASTKRGIRLIIAQTSKEMGM